MNDRKVFRGLFVMLAATGAGLLAFFALPHAIARYVVPGCFLVAFCSLALFYRDFQRSLRQENGFDRVTSRDVRTLPPRRSD